MTVETRMGTRAWWSEDVLACSYYFYTTMYYYTILLYYYTILMHYYTILYYPAGRR